MDTKKHYNELTPAQAERLALLIEELAEAQQEACKILRHGYESKNPLLPDRRLAPSNRENLQRELGHVDAAMRLLNDAGDLSFDAMDDYMREKLAGVRQWLHYEQVKPCEHRYIRPDTRDVPLTSGQHRVKALCTDCGATIDGIEVYVEVAGGDEPPMCGKRFQTASGIVSCIRTTPHEVCFPGTFYTPVPPDGMQCCDPRGEGGICCQKWVKVIG